MSTKRHEVARTKVGNTTVLVLRDSTFPLVRFTIGLRYGALADPKGAEGLWDLLLPLLLRGTRKKSRAAFNAELDALGSSVDTVVGHETAYISGTALKSELEATLTLLGEALRMPALDEEEFVAWRDEALQELIAERDDDEALAELYLRRALYGEHPMAVPASGTVASLAQLRIEQLRRAWGDVGQDHLIVGLVGDIAPADAEALVHKLVFGLPETGGALPQLPAPHYPTKPQIWVVDKPERTQVQLRVAIGGVAPKHPDLDAFWLGIVAFGGTFTSPLTHQVRDVRGWSYFASAEFRRRARLATPVVLRTAPALADAIPCLKLKLELLAELGEGSLEPESLALARNYLLGRVPLQVATAYDLLGPAIVLELLGLPLEQLWDLPERLQALDLHHVPFVVGKHLANFAPIAAMVAPAAEVVPQLEAQFAGVPIHVVSYTEGLPQDALGALE